MAVTVVGTDHGATPSCHCHGPEQRIRPGSRDANIPPCHDHVMTPTRVRRLRSQTLSYGSDISGEWSRLARTCWLTRSVGWLGYGLVPLTLGRLRRLNAFGHTAPRCPRQGEHEHRYYAPGC